MYRWELDGPAQQEFADLPPAARASLAVFMDAVVIVDPVRYQRRRDERDEVTATPASASASAPALTAQVPVPLVPRLAGAEAG